MNAYLRTAASEHGGYFTRAEVLDAGYRDPDIRAAIRANEWCRVRRSYYAFVDQWVCLMPEGRHVVRARIVADRFGDRVAMSHSTSCAVRNRWLWNQDLATVHVTRLDGRSGGIEAGVVHHVGSIDPDADVEVVDGLLCVRDPRATGPTRAPPATLLVARTGTRRAACRHFTSLIITAPGLQPRCSDALLGEPGTDVARGSAGYALRR